MPISPGTSDAVLQVPTVDFDHGYRHRGSSPTRSGCCHLTVIAACTVIVPVLGYAVAADRMRGLLDTLEEWLERNNAAVMMSLCRSAE